jgi:hypothetical protein
MNIYNLIKDNFCIDCNSKKIKQVECYIKRHFDGYQIPHIYASSIYLDVQSNKVFNSAANIWLEFDEYKNVVKSFNDEFNCVMFNSHCQCQKLIYEIVIVDKFFHISLKHNSRLFFYDNKFVAIYTADEINFNIQINSKLIKVQNIDLTKSINQIKSQLNIILGFQ